MPHDCTPREVRSVLNPNSCESASLRLSKFLRIPLRGEQTEKTAEIMSFVACFNGECPESRNVAFRVPELFVPKAARIFALRLGGRLVVDHSRGALENVGIRLHRNFSYPEIPGSALKGVARHWAWERWNEEPDENKKSELAKKLAEVFGFPTGNEALDKFLIERFSTRYGGAKNIAFAGTVAFLSAIPSNEKSNSIRLEVDVCTCHHPDYYKPKNSTHPKALDDESPNPQPFPVLAAGTTFVFRLVPLRADADLDFAENALRLALALNGVGAKTAAGYGWFEDSPEGDLKLRRKAEIATAGNSPQILKILNMKNSELKDFLKRDFLHPEEQEALKVAHSHFRTGHLKTLKEIWKKGKGTAFNNLSATFGDKASELFSD